jgi:hypothetical protein
MYDVDTNRDGKLDTVILNPCILSDISGKNFTKISANFQNVDWNLVESKPFVL